MSEPAIPPAEQRKGPIVAVLWAAAIALALCAAFARHADGRSVLSPALEWALQTPLLAIWLLCRCHRGPSAADRWLTAFVLIGGIVLATQHASPSLFFLAATTFVCGSLLLEQLAGLYRKLDARIDEPLALLRTVWRSWWLLLLASTFLLSIPLGTRSAVPDYRHSFWSHVLDNAFVAASSVCLVCRSVRCRTCAWA